LLDQEGKGGEQGDAKGFVKEPARSARGALLAHSSLPLAKVVSARAIPRALEILGES
jgi:hypothetical protein